MAWAIRSGAKPESIQLTGNRSLLPSEGASAGY
jgi:hypothetical protein